MAGAWDQAMTLVGAAACWVAAARCLLAVRFLLLWALGGHRAPARAAFRRLGKWAVITGAGDGIGKAYSLQLARLGLNTVLIGRTRGKLQALAAQIRRETGRDVLLMEADFTRTDIYEGIRAGLRGLDVGVLVNNVGLLPNLFPACFLDGPDLDEDLVHCNVTSVIKMSRLVLPGMESRGRGLIVNLSSGAGLGPWPHYALYSASKGLVCAFSKAVEAEYQEKGIIVQVVTPFAVSTPMTGHLPPNFFVKTPEAFVREALALAASGGQVCGCLAHDVLRWLLGLIPSGVFYSNTLRRLLLDRYTRYLRACGGVPGPPTPLPPPKP
ncbi:testosterone 17-beta-dehydrogenase 3 isoform X2 [Tachyglossus aculeatus]|uniref:testosterone 17-beta-dehydrogenase 3 isoform X2 n=1 Tax=Tachyglossus aculeatus TaxID=9261 RepID=UPI0018F78321|nr:testosterone 17-beta-dehydrogenase 3 isoform X2 [Tachyglossus aculeatus]